MTKPREPAPGGAPALIKIGDFARLAGTNLRTLRYYEELGLLTPAQRSQGGFRYYRATDAQRLAMIHDLQELGLPLERIRELMATRVGGDRDKYFGNVARALDEQDRLLAKRIADLSAQREHIAAAKRKVHECARCKHTPSSDNNFCEPCVITGEPLPPKVSALF